MEGIGARLAAARKSRGLSIDALSRETRVPAEHLLAIEEGRTDDLPPGPYRNAWTRLYCEAVGVTEPDASVEPIPEARLPLSVVRGLGLAAVVALVLVVGVVQWARQKPAPQAPETVAIADQVVSISARQSVRLTVRVDGEARYDDVLSGGAQVEFEAFDRIEVDVAAVEAVRVHYNGRSIVPQGRQDAPRTLVFIDDGSR